MAGPQPSTHRWAAHDALAQFLPMPIDPCHVQPKPQRSNLLAYQLYHVSVPR